MSIKTTDRFQAQSRGTVADVLAFFNRHPPKRRAEAEACVRRVKALCDAAGIDFALAIARIGDETGSLTSGAIFVSDIWNARLNPGGIGVTDGDDEMIAFDTGAEAADAYMAHLFTYVLGESFNVLGVKPATDPRFSATPKAWRGSVKTLADLTGKWFTNPHGAANSAARGNRIFPNIPDQQTGGVIVPTRGKVPKPPVNEYHVRAVVESNCDAYPNRAAQIVGSCHHTSDGFMAGNRQVFRNPAWGGLTDYGIGGPWDGSLDGVIDQYIDPDADVAPYANGTVGKATAPYGDGDDFVAQFGVAAVNGRLRSIETTDGAQANRTKGGRQIESLCFLTAYIHAEEAGQSWDEFAWNMHHREFGVPHQGCPGAWIVNHVDVIQARTRDIMRAYQTHTPLDQPLLITYPPGWAGGVIAQPGATATPKPEPTTPRSPILVFPTGVDEALASEWFGTLTVAGRSFSFSPEGSVSKVWLANAATTGEYPRLATYRRFGDGREYWGFANGLVIAKLGKGKAPQVLARKKAA